MQVLFDHGTPRDLAAALPDHVVISAKSKGWDRLSNGDLLNAAEEAGFNVFITTDQRIRYQQNLAKRKIALVVLTGTTKWSRVQFHGEQIAAAVAAATPGSYAEVFIPFGHGPASSV